MWTPVLHPEDGPATPYTEWTFRGPVTRMPEFTAPKLGKFNNTVSMDVDVPEKANGVLYALGGFSAGLTCYVQDGVLCYEYNLFELQRTQIKAKDKLPAGKVTIEVESKLAAARPGSPMDVTLKVGGKVVATGAGCPGFAVSGRFDPAAAACRTSVRSKSVRRITHGAPLHSCWAGKIPARIILSTLILLTLSSVAASSSVTSPRSARSPSR